MHGLESVSPFTLVCEAHVNWWWWAGPLQRMPSSRPQPLPSGHVRRFQAKAGAQQGLPWTIVTSWNSGRFPASPDLEQVS